MPQPPNYRRRRIVLVAAAALLLVGASHRAPMIGRFSVTVEDDLMPRFEAEWAPPAALAIAAAGRLGGLLGTNRTR